MGTVTKINDRQVGAVAKAKTIFDLAADKSRKEAIELAVKVAGLKKSTASTQYQNWKKSRPGRMSGT